MNVSCAGPLVVLALTMLIVGCEDASPPATGPSPAVSTVTAPVANISGQVRDTIVRPVGGARVEIISGSLAGRVTTTTDDGRFAFLDSIPVSEVVNVQVTKEGYSAVTARWRGPNEIYVRLTALTLVDLAGQYTVTFTAAGACSQIPPAFRTRTFIGTVSPTNSPETFTSELSGADFYPAYDTFSAFVGSKAVRISLYSWDAFNWWLEDQPIIERLPSDAFLSFTGNTTTPVAPSNTSISAMFDGSISYCAAATQPTNANFPPTCSAPIECKSAEHRIAFSRR